MKIEGLQLWEVEVCHSEGYQRKSTALWITTARPSLEAATSKARKFIRRKGFDEPVIRSIKDRGTLDA